MRRASSAESSAKAAKAYKVKVASLTSKRVDLGARIQSLTDDVLGYKSDLKHTSTAKARAEGREKKAIEGLRFVEDELRAVKEEFQATKEKMCAKAEELDRPAERLLKLRARWSAWLRSAVRYVRTSKGGRL